MRCPCCRADGLEFQEVLHGTEHYYCRKCDTLAAFSVGSSEASTDDDDDDPDYPMGPIGPY
jgi:hypothetical protein